MPKENTAQKRTVGRVMHEYKHHELESGRRGRGGKVKSRRQAIAIALSEAGASNRKSGSENKRSLSKTKSKERRGQTAQQRKEGRNAMNRRSTTTRRTTAARGTGPTRAELYRQAMRRKIPGRSRMTKAELQRALKK